MHHIHHTEAFVLGSRPKGEDSKILFLFTRELGLVYAHAQGLRKLSSKLRYTLQDLSRVQVDLVRGKEVWRVTTAVPAEAGGRLRRAPANAAVFARIASLLIRLVTGEEANEELFGVLSRAITLLDQESLSSEKYRMIELLSVSRILTALGYLSRPAPVLFQEGEEEIPQEFSDIAYQHRLIRDINQALAASQL